MTVGLDTKTLRWNFVDSIEPPRTVHCRTTDLLTKDNLYAQVTVRFHTRQVRCASLRKNFYAAFTKGTTI